MKYRNLLVIHSYPGGNETAMRHHRFWDASGADFCVGVGTNAGGTWFPWHYGHIELGEDKYLDASHLPQRLVDTMGWFWTTGADVMALLEYDCIPFKPLPFSGVKGIACHHTGSQTWGSKASFYSHNPWLVTRDTARAICTEGQKAIDEGICAWNAPESSPDVFIAYVCERLGIVPDFEAFTLFTRNKLDIPGDLQLARDAYRNKVDCIHGIKSADQLEFITT